MTEVDPRGVGIEPFRRATNALGTVAGMEVGRPEGFVLNLRAWMCTGFRDLPALENASLGEGSRAESRWEKAHQKDILQRLIGVIGVQESEVDGNGD